MRIFLIVVFCFFSISFYGQNDTLSIVKHTDNSFVIPKDLKVVFRGIANELFVDVPNCKSFEVTGNGVSKKEKNIYKINPGAGLEAIVSIDITLKNNKKIVEKHVFKIRNMLSPITCFNFTKGDTIISIQKKQFNDATVRVISADKNLNLTFEVVQFTVHIPGRQAIVVNGNKIDKKTFDEISKYASKQDMITISDVKSRSKRLFYGCILINPLVIKVL